MDAFDKHIHSLFDDHEVPVDTEQLWKNVEPRLGRKTGPRRLIFLLFLLIGLPLGYLFLTIPGDQGPIVSSTPDTDKQSFFGRKGQLIDNHSKTDSQETEKILIVENSIKNKSSSEKAIPVADPRPARETMAASDHNEIKENDVWAESKVNTFSSESFELKPRAILSTNKVATNTAIQPVISLYQKKVKTDLPVFNQSNFSWSLALFAGADYTSKYLGTKIYDYNWYKKERLNSEKILESFNLGFHVQLDHKSGIFGGTGLVYHQINELFESSGTQEIRFFKEGVVQIITNADGSSYEVTGQKLAIEHKNWNKKIYNNFGFINVPIYLGYGHGTGKMKLEYNAGIDVNIYFNQEGEILGKEGFPVSVSKPQNSIFNNLTTINLNGGIKLLYPFSERFIVFVEPNFHYNLGSITIGDYPLEQRYLHTGIRFGSRINL